MFKSQFGSALMRLFCLLALALCFSGLAHAQTQPTLTLSADPPALEGAPATFRVTLSTPASQRLTFSFFTSPGNGPTGALEVPNGPFDADYDGFSTNGDYTIEVGQSVVQIKVPTFQDTSYEFDENFGAFISNPRYNGQRAGSNVLTLGQTQATGTILNDDSPPQITLVQPDPILEGDTDNRASQNYQFTVNIGNTLNSPDQETLGRDITLAFTTIDGTATSRGNNPGDRDFTPVSSDVRTIPAGTRQYPYNVTVLGDNVYERDEAFSLRVQYSPPLANTVPSTTSGVIRDNDLPTYTINTADADARTTVEEGNPVIFMVVLRDRQGNEIPALDDITFNYSVQDITANQGQDFTDPNNGSFTIAAGKSRFALTFPTIDDNVIEQTETFRFIVRDAVGTLAPQGNGANAGIGTILDTADNNAGTVLTLQDATVEEGTGGTNNISFTVNLSRATGQSVSVSYETVNSNDPNPAARATSGVDYTPTTGRVTFAPNQTAATFTVPVTTDSINELDENFRVRLFNPTNAAFANNTVAIFAKGTIIDDDDAGVISTSRAAVDVAENVQSGHVDVLVNFKSNATQKRPVTVDFTTIPDTAQQVDPRDYFGKSGTLTFQPGVTQQAIRIEIVNDNVSEGNESFNVVLSNPNGATLGPQSQTKVTILDDDRVPSVSVRPVAPVNEGDGVRNIEIAIRGSSQTPVTVGYNFTDGTATNGVDYTAADGTAIKNGSVTFTPGGPTSISIPVQIVDDNIAEGNETFSFKLTKSPTDNSFTLPSATATALVTIVDNDGKPAFKIGDAQIVEGSTGDINSGNELVFPVTLSRPSSLEVYFVYSTQNLGKPNCTPANGCDIASNNDYAPVSNVVVRLAPGETKGEIRIRVAPDTLNEYNEQFAIVVSSLGRAVPASYSDNGMARIGTTAYGTIINDDAGGQITVGGPTDAAGKAITTITEGYKLAGSTQVGDTGNFVVTLPTPAGRNITVNYFIIPSSVADNDVEDLTTNRGRGQLVFANGATTRTISLRALPDNVVEGTERLRVVLSLQDRNGANSYVANNVTSNELAIADSTPQVNTVTPTTGFPAYSTVAGTSVVINGAQLRTNGNPRVNAVLFNGSAATGIQYVSDNSISVIVPANAKSGPLRLRLVDGTIVSTVGRTSTDPNRPARAIPDFIVQPVILSFSPTAGVPRSSTISITGLNFQDGNNPVTAVRFNNSARALVGQNATVISDTRIDVVLPANASEGPLRIETSKGGVGPASQDSLAIVSSVGGGLRLGANPDRNAIVEGSVGTFEQPVRNVNGSGTNTFHAPYQFFLDPARQNGGNNSGNPFAVTPLTVRFQITSSTGGGRFAAIAVRADLANATRPTTLNGRSNASGYVDLALDERFDPTTPLFVAIVDAGTDDVPPIIGGTPAKVTVTARIIKSDNTAFYPITPTNQTPTIQVDRIQSVNSGNQTAIAFGPNTRANFSVPFSDGNTNSVPLTSVFNTPPIVNGVRRYLVLRLDVANQTNHLDNSDGNEGSDFVPVDDNGRLERGVGYRLVVADKATVQLRTKGSGLVTPAGDTFTYKLTRNVTFAATANNQGNSTNGYNFIGFPFDPSQFQNLDFNQGIVTFKGVDRSVPDAAAAGLINPKLLTLDSNGALVPVDTTTINPFQAYFVQAFRDDLTLTLKKPTS